MARYGGECFECGIKFSCPDDWKEDICPQCYKAEQGEEPEPFYPPQREPIVSDIGRVSPPAPAPEAPQEQAPPQPEPAQQSVEEPFLANSHDTGSNRKLIALGIVILVLAVASLRFLTG